MYSLSLGMRRKTTYRHSVYHVVMGAGKEDAGIGGDGVH